MKYKAKMWGLSLTCLLLVSTTAACSNGKNNSQAPNNQESTTAPTNSTVNSDASTNGSESNVYPENGLPKDKKVTLKFGYWENASGREWIDYAIETFTKKYPNVSFDTTYSPKIDTITATKIAAKNDDDMFDIFSNLLPGGGNANAMATSLVEAGKLEPQDDLWDHKALDNEAKTLKELQSGIYEGRTLILGKMYAIPYGQSITGLYYNKALFEKNGWNQNPKTWSEFKALIDTIKAAGTIPITYPGKYPGYLDFSIGIAKMFEIAEINGNLDKFNDDYRNFKAPFYASPESLDVYNRIYELGQKKAFPDGVAALTHTQSQMQLLQGQAALASTGEWVQNEMKDSIPDGFKWGFMLVPMGDNPDSTKYYQSYAGGGHYTWAAKPELNKKWAKEFLVWLWNLDVQQRFAEEAGGLPVRTDFMDDAALVEKLQDAPKAVLEYLKNNNVKGTSESRSVTLTDPNSEKARKLVEETVNDIASGKQDPQPKLQEAENLLAKAIAAQK
ncbi:sugar ABC transporter substrate-binding protein [Paenibacillus baekrokdamisoli]|uniref:Sugar ABC transporter substrate-binding protein n=1 Tax=Paenibacillus baekrokdamisoli TaxID=1712516 RepID=A0A3G9IX81_9BACL|nr:extracellular solute-binding protein [Paenibacillus baekrokdamisoli]MBB3068696.1 N-acetylglucosamine transport system substrate-binding protein [Paenibacillus baekrokdamisoli]BBH23527.1 sugar ABC transporter substrate-binding protein [Paenibacillus baekrokdamisoli]